ncbi:uncharacterized protein SAMN02746041_00727 [Desulfacinum hydrothermale DSM 13146]|uniref:DUF177 domain-containing protein n=1 Tax=Desulfacinum hydrothermale DSM 13146 TaxID=1121390 RepID=A0A1W1X779_9BACT|nr:DUF177 domain-containing protein [Desulfacinum hydrothermale]SMC19608.1 uncharacterized protein SAMN02746041_00727 [Desulfacinum hydrothermale DSM 13146]
MKIRLDEIPEAGRFLHLHWTQESLEKLIPPHDPSGLKLKRPLNVDLEIHRRADHVEVTGTLTGIISLLCDRCLESYHKELRRSVRILLYHEEASEAGEEEVELAPEDLEYEFFDGETLEIDRLIAEEIFLDLPFRSLCSEECKGLCAGCGANLNTEPCTCEGRHADHPFARLATLKLNGSS